LTGGLDDPQPDRHAGNIAIRSEFLGSHSAFQLGRLAVTVERPARERLAAATWQRYTASRPAASITFATLRTLRPGMGCVTPGQFLFEQHSRLRDASGLREEGP